MTRSVSATGSMAARRWMSREEASRALGISATTLRRWSDAGMVETFVTPGGHRRFDAASVAALMPGTQSRPTMERLGETPERMSRVYRRASDRKSLPWVGSLDVGQRNAFRSYGRIIAGELLATLDAATERDRAAHLATASETAAHYGVAAAAQGLRESTTAHTFLRFRRPFLVEQAAGGLLFGLDTAAATDLIARASDAIDDLLIATLGAHEAALASTASPQPPLAAPELDPRPAGMARASESSAS